jgi:hypothetical protein
MEPAEQPPRKKEPARRGNVPPDLKEMERLVDRFGEEFAFAREEVGKLKAKMAQVIEAWRRTEAHHVEEHHQVRAKLNTLFNGRIERWINASDDEEMKAFFRRVWRD